MDVLNRLQSHPLFAGLAPEALAEAARAGTAVTFGPGDSCLRGSDAGEVFGVLISGKLEVSQAGEDGGREVLGEISPGECFGEMSLLTGNPSGADVTAVMESEAIVFPEEAIGPILAGDIGAVRFLTRLMQSRLSPRGSRAAAPRPAQLHYSLGDSSAMRVLSLSCRRDALRFSYYDTSSEQARADGRVNGLGGEAASISCHGPKGASQGAV
ncbi:hypothetical protein LCGC14_3102600, partial [marine sediment metagenome]